jgi:hypothetical protein
MAAIVVPVGFRSIAMMRAFLEPGRAAGRGDAAAGVLLGAGLAVFRVVERVEAFGLGLGLVMGSSEVCATPSAAPPQPRPDKAPGRAGSRAGLSRPKSPQQRSVLARMPVNSEQDCCWLGREVGRDGYPALVLCSCYARGFHDFIKRARQRIRRGSSPVGPRPPVAARGAKRVEPCRR